jgi:hypothetical protein
MSAEVASLGMREPTFLILTALAAEPTHGCGVIHAVEQLSHGEVALRRNADATATRLRLAFGGAP